MRTSEVLEKAWSYIDVPEKWIQGKYNDHQNNHFCSVGALYMATNGKVDLSKRPPEFIAAKTVLEECLPKSSNVIEGYNDKRTYKTITKLWQKAIRKAKADEGEVIEMPDPVVETEEIAGRELALTP